MDNISKLFYKQLTGTLTPAEKQELDNWMAASEQNAEVGRRLSDIAFLQREYEREGLIDTDRAKIDMERRIAALPEARRRRWYVAAAASVAVLLGAAVWYMARQSESLMPETELVAEAPNAVSLDDFKAGEQMAYLSDESGTALTLKNDDGENPIAWEVKPNEPAAKMKLEELKLNVPRGKEFKIVLEDSTVVWLNSESTLKYPKLFGDKERRVEVDGEAYFQVKKDSLRPFYVVSGGQQIRVYGTTFNVRNYPEEESVMTTLETGSIALTRCGEEDGAELRLFPGHQAVFEKNEQRVALRTVKPEVITGWRHGKFVFEEQPLSAIMRDLARWYNFEYEFADEAVNNLVFKGSIPRYSNLKTAIDILEVSGGITFTVVDNKIVIASE